MLTASVPADPGSYYAKEGLEAEGGFMAPVGGKMASKLGLSGVIDRDTLKALFRNRTPEGERLTQRDRADKKPVTDFCFSVSKPVALAHQLFGDARIPGEVAGAAMDTARMMERKITVRTMRRKKYQDITTGIGLIAPEYHKRTRPVGGVSDPGDHVHTLFLNVSELDGKRRSVQLERIVKDSALYRDMFHANLRGRMERLGYSTHADGFTFGIDGFSKELCRKFSRRSELIEMEVKRRGIKSPKGKAALGAKIREKKANDLKEDRLFDEWLKRLTPNEYKLAGSATRRAMASGPIAPNLFNEDHLLTAFDRLMDAYSRVSEEKLLTEALKEGVGEVSLDGLTEALEGMEAIRAQVKTPKGKVAMVQSRDNHQREAELVSFAKKGGIVWITGKPTEETKEEAEQRAGEDATWIRTVQSFRQVHQAAMEAKEEGRKLVIQGLAPKNAPEGHVLAVLRELGGISPLDEKDSRKRKKVLSVAATLKGFKERVRHRMEVMRRLDWMKEIQPEVEGAERARSASWDRDRRGVER